MKSWIDLEKTVFDFPRVVGDHLEMCTVWGGPGRLIQVTDFATVIVGWDAITDARWRASIVDSLALEARQAPIFTAPEGWGMAHVLKALGAFPSIGEAKRNGWDKAIPEGVTDHVCRIRKIKGVIVTFKPPATILQSGSWESCKG